jgi:RND family efflux transporter MFP subunit
MKFLIHFCLIFSLLTLTACDKSSQDIKAPHAQQLKPVRTITIGEGAQSIKTFPGVIDAIQNAEIGFRVSGVLKKVNVKEGEIVKKGQVIAELDQTDFTISLNANQSEFDRTNANFNRASKLIKKGAISQSDFEKLKAEKNIAKSQLNSAKQNLKYTVLTSPFDGIVARTYLSNFEKVSTSEQFAAIQDLSAFEVSIDIPESLMIKIKGNENNHDVYAAFDSIDERKFPLTFKEVSTRADEKTQTYKIKFIMQAPTSINVLPGMSATIFAIEKKSAINHDIYAPSHSVLEDSAGRFVYAVKKTPDKMQGVVVRRNVVVGQVNENGIQIIQGLKVGDRVITAGMSKVFDGLNVALMDEAR